MVPQRVLRRCHGKCRIPDSKQILVSSEQPSKHEYVETTRVPPYLLVGCIWGILNRQGGKIPRNNSLYTGTPHGGLLPPVLLLNDRNEL